MSVLLELLDALAMILGVAWFATVTITMVFSPLWDDSMWKRVSYLIVFGATFIYILFRVFCCG